MHKPINPGVVNMAWPRVPLLRHEKHKRSSCHHDAHPPSVCQPAPALKAICHLAQAKQVPEQDTSNEHLYKQLRACFLPRSTGSWRRVCKSKGKITPSNSEYHACPA